MSPFQLLWMTAEQAWVLPRDVSTSCSQFSQSCHNYNIFDNRVLCVCVCVCLFCVILFKHAELSGCTVCVNMRVTAGCVWWAACSTSVALCKLPSGARALLVLLPCYCKKNASLVWKVLCNQDIDDQNCDIKVTSCDKRCANSKQTV
jgi:hypothetical protein